MILRMALAAFAVISIATFGAPVRATTNYTFSGTVDGASTSFGLGTAIDFVGTLTDPSTVMGEGSLSSTIEIAALSIGGVPQTGVSAAVLRLSSPSRLEIFVTFQGATNPDLFVSVFPPTGWESSFPELTFDLTDPGASVQASEINEDGVLPDSVAITSFTAVPEPSISIQYAVAACAIAFFAIRSVASKDCSERDATRVQTFTKEV